MEITIREFIEEALSDARRRLHDATIDLTPDQLSWQPQRATDPSGANSIGFMLWHIGRVEDNFVQRFIQRADEVWAAGGWQEKLGYETRGIGTGFSPEEAARVPAPSAEVLWGYLDDVRARTLQYLAALDWSTLTDKPRADRFPEWSIQTILRQIIAHSHQHLGQIDYIRGLLGLPGALG